MKKQLLYLSCMMLLGCGAHAQIIQKEPWLTQNIVTEKSCDILMPPALKIIKIGDRYTATYKIMENFILHKTPKRDFTSENEIQYYSDTCLLKSDLRKFISIKMAETISYRTFNKSK